MSNVAVVNLVTLFKTTAVFQSAAMDIFFLVSNATITTRYQVMAAVQPAQSNPHIFA